MDELTTEEIGRVRLVVDKLEKSCFRNGYWAAVVDILTGRLNPRTIANVDVELDRSFAVFKRGNVPEGRKIPEGQPDPRD